MALNRFGDKINFENVTPTEYVTSSFFTEEIGTVRQLKKVNFESELLLTIREDDPASPVEGEIWLRRLP